MPQLRRHAHLARALASGATVTEIAEDEAISRALTSREANSRECLQLIAEFVDAEHELMAGLGYRAVRVIEEAFEATREYTTEGWRGRSGWSGPLRPTRRDEAPARFSHGGPAACKAWRQTIGNHDLEGNRATGDAGN